MWGQEGPQKISLGGDIRTSRLYDWIGPVGRFSENLAKEISLSISSSIFKLHLTTCLWVLYLWYVYLHRQVQDKDKVFIKYTICLELKCIFYNNKRNTNIYFISRGGPRTFLFCFFRENVQNILNVFKKMYLGYQYKYFSKKNSLRFV